MVTHLTLKTTYKDVYDWLDENKYTFYLTTFHKERYFKSLSHLNGFQIALTIAHAFGKKFPNLHIEAIKFELTHFTNIECKLNDEE